MTDTMLQQQKQLAWQCRRGMLELDVVLIPFLERHFLDLNESQQALFKTLLGESDPDLYSWLMGFAKPSNTEYLAMIQLIQTKMKIATRL
ncbi:FAD assembly factor SdhE [Aliikangiella sp. IMCC44653]